MSMSESEVREWSLSVFDKIASDDAGMIKHAAQDLTDYTRVQNREASFVNRIIEPSQFDKSKVVPQLHTDQPVMYFDWEISAPFAAPVDFASTPADYIPKGRRYPLTLQRVQTPKVTKELLELESYAYDLRQIMSDAMTKELVAIRDYRFLRAVRQILGTTPGTVLPWVGKAMYVDMGVAITHNNLNRGKDVLRDTRFNIEPTKLLASHLRKSDFESAWLDELHGTDRAVDLVTKGFSEATYQGLDIIFTTKKAVVPKADMFLFGPQEYLGRYVQYMPPTLSVKKDDDMVISFYQYEIFGMTIAHPGALCGLQYL
jgi:hypothetical protein